MEIQDRTKCFLFDNLRVETIRQLQAYIKDGKGTLAELKDRYRTSLHELTENEREEINTVEKFVEALKEQGAIRANDVMLLRLLAEEIGLEELKQKVEEYEADCAGIFRRTLNGTMIHLKTLVSSRGVQITIAGAILMRIYGNNPERLLNLQPFVEFAAELIDVVRGSIVFVLKVSSISSVKRLWQSYKDGSLKEKLKKSLNEMEELKELSKGEEIDVEVTIDEEEYHEALYNLILFDVKGKSMKDDKSQRRHSVCCERDVPVKVDQVLSQGQQGQKRSSADVQPEEDVKTKKPRTTINNRERDHAEDSEMLKEAIKANTENQTKIMAAHDIPSAKTDDIFTNLTVREQVEKNENLISFCHIPLLSFLLCWCLEWRISRSGITENLPAKITDLYDDVVKVLIEKLHANLKYSEMSEYAKKIAEETINKLAKLAANLQKESKYIFDEEDMKKLDLSEDEIKNLKVSGILHCVPGIRITAFETKAEFSFTHLTLQEYLSASFFVKYKEIPEDVSNQTFVFMCGLLSKKKDGEQLMNKLIQQISPKDNRFKLNKLRMLQCLYEYGEQELTTITMSCTINTVIVMGSLVLIE
ncbi:uncharacterized protein LOC116292220 [Actinia tenebrosa]|uniref:Uncharacterized protein LOC116292220 n=1 Tax=Actinia tenebrosa TaxID=6105 RepID=A0A6P8HKC8_ACTTE|nr:uncharacterized protein LOC116292220 [Actinia tenebrosa]